MLHSRFCTLRDLEVKLNTHMSKVNCNKNVAAQTAEGFHVAAGDIQVRQGRIESLLCTLLFWTAELGSGVP